MELPRITQLARVMQEAHPYIEKYLGKIIVVKYGGSAMIEASLRDAVMQDLLLLNLIGIRVVLVHGGGPFINARLKSLNKQSIFIQGVRVTDRETMEVVQETLVGKVNKNLVAKLQGKGIGLCGMDGAMILCKPDTTVEGLGFVGEIESIQPALLEYLLKNGLIPVVASVGMDKEGVTYNINADTVAYQLAVALGAFKVINMTDVPGILRQKENPLSLIEQINLEDIQQLITQHIIKGGMVPKVTGAMQCLESGVEEVTIMDGRMPHALLQELFSDKGNGTLIHSKRGCKL